MSKQNKPSFVWMKSIRTVADELGVSQKLIRAAIDQGALRAYRLGTARAIRIDPADLSDWITEVNPAGRALREGGDQ